MIINKFIIIWTLDLIKKFELIILILIFSVILIEIYYESCENWLYLVWKYCYWIIEN